MDLRAENRHEWHQIKLIRTENHYAQKKIGVLPLQNPKWVGGGHSEFLIQNSEFSSR